MLRRLFGHVGKSERTRYNTPMTFCREEKTIGKISCDCGYRVLSEGVLNDGEMIDLLLKHNELSHPNIKWEVEEFRLDAN